MKYLFIIISFVIVSLLYYLNQNNIKDTSNLYEPLVEQNNTKQKIVIKDEKLISIKNNNSSKEYSSGFKVIYGKSYTDREYQPDVNRSDPKPISREEMMEIEKDMQPIITHQNGAKYPEDVKQFMQVNSYQEDVNPSNSEPLTQDELNEIEEYLDILTVKASPTNRPYYDEVANINEDTN